jgi:hypothetical protein
VSRRPRSTSAALAVAATAAVLPFALLVGGCGGDDEGSGPAAKAVDGRKVGAVRSCLEEAGFTVEDRSDGDVRLVDGVSGTKPGADVDEVAYGGAGHARSARDVAAFTKATKQAKAQQTPADAKLLELDAGSEGRYVWAVGGVPGSKGLAAARACVEP